MDEFEFKVQVSFIFYLDNHYDSFFLHGRAPPKKTSALKRLSYYRLSLQWLGSAVCNNIYISIYPPVNKLIRTILEGRPVLNL